MLPLPHRSPRLREVYDAWRLVCPGEGVPDAEEVLAEAERLGASGLATVLLELRRPPALVALASSPAIDAHLGFALRGADILEMTYAADRPTRYGRFHHVVHDPCGLQVRDNQLPSGGGEAAFEALYLPVRRTGGEQPCVLGIFAGHEPLTPRPMAVPLVAEAAWVDLGAGVPKSLYDPEPWLRAAHRGA